MSGQKKPSFSEELAGTEPGRWDRDLALLSSATYRDDADQGALPRGWTQVSAEECRSAKLVADASQKSDPADVQLNDPSKFRACVYKHESGERYAVVFRGTKTMSWKKADSLGSFAESWKNDLAVNVGQGVGLDTKQYELALNVAQRAKARWGNNVVFAGHSLGGGLAAAASIYTRNSAVTFNAAGVHENTFDRASTFKDDARSRAEHGAIRSIVVEGDALNEAQSGKLTVFRLAKAITGGVPKSAGVQVDMPHPYMEPGTGKGVKLHGLEATVSAMDTTMLNHFTDARISNALMAALARSRNPSDSEFHKQVHAIKDHVDRHHQTHGIEASVQRGVAAMAHGDHAIRNPREKLADFRNRPGYGTTAHEETRLRETDAAVKEYARTQLPADAWRKQSTQAQHAASSPVSASPSRPTRELADTEARLAAALNSSQPGKLAGPRPPADLKVSIPAPARRLISQPTTVEPPSTGSAVFFHDRRPSPDTSSAASSRPPTRSSSPPPSPSDQDAAMSAPRLVQRRSSNGSPSRRSGDDNRTSATTPRKR